MSFGDSFKIELSAEAKDEIEHAFTRVVAATAAQTIESMQRIAAHRDLILTAVQTQISREAINSGVVADALAEAIKALPPDKLIEFVKATEANATQIHIGRLVGAA